MSDAPPPMLVMAPPAAWPVPVLMLAFFSIVPASLIAATTTMDRLTDHALNSAPDLSTLIFGAMFFSMGFVGLLCLDALILIVLIAALAVRTWMRGAQFVVSLLVLFCSPLFLMVNVAGAVYIGLAALTTMILLFHPSSDRWFNRRP